MVIGSVTVSAGASGILPAGVYVSCAHDRDRTGGQAARGTQNRMSLKVSRTRGYPTLDVRLLTGPV